MDHFFEIVNKSAPYILVSLVSVIAAKLDSIFKLAKTALNLARRKKVPPVKVPKEYLTHLVSGRFGFYFLECKLWDKLVPYNGDGYTFVSRDDSSIEYNVSAHFDRNPQYDMLHHEVEEAVKQYPKYYPRFRLLQSRRSSVKLIDIQGQKIIPKGDENAYRLVYQFKKGKVRITVTEVIVAYRGVRFRFYFQAPSKKYHVYVDFMNHLLSEYYILHEDSNLYLEKFIKSRVRSH